MRYRRSLLASFLVIVLTALLLSACSNNNKENKLSELDDIKLNQYMTDSGITIPESVDMDTIRSIIIELEDNPEHPAPIVGDTLIADLYEDIRNLVVEYEAGDLIYFLCILTITTRRVKMKRLFALVLSFCMALSIGVCAAAAETPLRENENGVLLSSLDYEECRNFLLNQGVSIPEELSGIDLPKLFADLESNPDMKRFVL